MRRKIVETLKKVFLKLEKKCLQFRIYFLGAFIIGILGDIFYFKTSSDFRFFPFLFLWISILKFYRFKSNSTFKVSLVFLILLFIFFVFARNSPTTEKIATYIYLFLVVGVIHQFAELRSRDEKNA